MRTARPPDRLLRCATGSRRLTKTSKCGILHRAYHGDRLILLTNLDSLRSTTTNSFVAMEEAADHAGNNRTHCPHVHLRRNYVACSLDVCQTGLKISWDFDCRRRERFVFAAL